MNASAQALDDLKVFKSWSKSTKTIMSALGRGSIRAIGGMLYDVDMANLRGLSPIDLHKAIQEASPWLQANKATVERGDAGGSPTWNMIVRP